MAARTAELLAEQESKALSRLQAAAGVMDKPHAERLDWMYEQSAFAHKTDEELMNMPVAGQKDQDLEDVKKLGENTAGSLFLKSATKTTEDTLRKLREDPLFQIRRQEQAAKESMLSNPLIAARLKEKAEKKQKKAQKKLKKAAKKEKRALKKLMKKEKKASSSSDSDSSDSIAGACPMHRRRGEGGASPLRQEASQRRGASPRRGSSPRRGAGSLPRKAARGAEDLGHLGPSIGMRDKRAERAAEIAAQQNEAVASRAAPRRMSEEERKQKLEQMRVDAARHNAFQDKKIEAAELAERLQEEKDARMRTSSDQSYFREIRATAYGDEATTVADRLRNQRHRRQKNINDPLERDA